MLNNANVDVKTKESVGKNFSNSKTRTSLNMLIMNIVSSAA